MSTDAHAGGPKTLSIAASTKVFKHLCLDQSNKLCFDCLTKNPKWATVPFGVYLCLDCAGEHRKMGTHISFVRSTDLDTWYLDQLLMMMAGGNAKATVFLRSHGGHGLGERDRANAQAKYTSKAAELYKQHLVKEVANSRVQLLQQLHALSPESETKPTAPTPVHGTLDSIFNDLAGLSIQKQGGAASGLAAGNTRDIVAQANSASHVQQQQQQLTTPVAPTAVADAKVIHVNPKVHLHTQSASTPATSTKSSSSTVTLPITASTSSSSSNTPVLRLDLAPTSTLSAARNASKAMLSTSRSGGAQSSSSSLTSSTLSANFSLFPTSSSSSSSTSTSATATSPTSTSAAAAAAACWGDISLLMPQEAPPLHTVPLVKGSTLLNAELDRNFSNSIRTPSPAAPSPTAASALSSLQLQSSSSVSGTPIPLPSPVRAVNTSIATSYSPAPAPTAASAPAPAPPASISSSSSTTSASSPTPSAPSSTVYPAPTATPLVIPSLPDAITSPSPSPTSASSHKPFAVPADSTNGASSLAIASPNGSRWTIQQQQQDATATERLSKMSNAKHISSDDLFDDFFNA